MSCSRAGVRPSVIILYTRSISYDLFFFYFAGSALSASLDGRRRRRFVFYFSNRKIIIIIIIKHTHTDSNLACSHVGFYFFHLCLSSTVCSSCVVAKVNDMIRLLRFITRVQYRYILDECDRFGKRKHLLCLYKHAEMHENRP